ATSAAAAVTAGRHPGAPPGTDQVSFTTMRRAATASMQRRGDGQRDLGQEHGPYWVLDSPYSLVSVKMVLAAGNVTRTMPCASPAALMIVRSVLGAIWPSRQLQPSGQSSGSYRRYRSLPAKLGAAIPPRS